jgi:hypothetical protein
MRMLPGATGVAEALGAAASSLVPEPVPCWTPVLSPALQAVRSAAVHTAAAAVAAKRHREVKLRVLNMCPLYCYRWLLGPM